MTLPLHDMIRRAIADASVKLAADEKAKEEKVKALLKQEKKEHGHIPSVSEERAEMESHEEKGDEGSTKTASLISPDYVEKLASAVEFIAVNADSIAPPEMGYLSQALAKMAEGQAGPGHGPGALAISAAIGGKQKYKKDQASSEKPEDDMKSGLSAAGLAGGKTQLDNTMHDAPGGGGLRPTGEYPAKGPLTNLAKQAGLGSWVAQQAVKNPRALYMGGGALAGGALGAGAGALTGGPDEHGQTHRLRNALIGGALGAGAGAGAGYGLQHYGVGKNFLEGLGKAKAAPVAATGEQLQLPGIGKAASMRDLYIAAVTTETPGEFAKAAEDAFGHTPEPPAPGSRKGRAIGSLAGMAIGGLAGGIGGRHAPGGVAIGGAVGAAVGAAVGRMIGGAVGENVATIKGHGDMAKQAFLGIHPTEKGRQQTADQLRRIAEGHYHSAQAGDELAHQSQEYAKSSPDRWFTGPRLVAGASYRSLADLRKARKLDDRASRLEKGDWMALRGNPNKPSRFETGELHESSLRPGEKTAAEARAYILRKLAGEDVLKSQISAQGSASPIVGGGVQKVMEAPQSGTGQPAGPNGGGGNSQRSHIQSIQAAINMTKRDAKRPVLDSLEGSVLENKLNQSTDSKLHENLRNAGTAGVKIAAKRALLEKIAREGTAEQRQQLRHLIKQANDAALQVAMAQGAPPADPGAGGAGPQGEPVADGCECGHTGVCRVCKLRAALEAAKGGGPVAAPPQEANPQAQAPQY